MGDLDEDVMTEMLRQVMEEGGQKAQEAMEACQKGMDIVGSRFEDGELKLDAALSKLTLGAKLEAFLGYGEADKAESVFVGYISAVETDIQGYDMDDAMVSIARENAKLAGVEKLIHFQRREVAQLSHPKKYGFIITNPPYGERLEEKEALPALYQTIGRRFRGLDDWSLYLITSYEQAERDIGRKADKNRKIYNGMMKTYYYQFLGPKPPRREGGHGK